MKTEENKEKYVTQEDLARMLMYDMEEEDTETKIDFRKYIQRLLSGKKTILWTTFIFAVLGVASALMSPRKYETSVVFAPELSKSSSSSSLSGIASMLGLGNLTSMMGGSADAYNVMMYPDIISSTPFLTSLFDIRVVDPENEIDTIFAGYLTRPRGIDWGELLGLEKKKTKDLLDIDNFQLSKKQAAIVKKLTKCISVSVDKKTGITTVSVVADNPYVSAIVADSVCSRLKTYIYNYRTQKSRDNLAYYQKLCDESFVTYTRLMEEYANYQDQSHGLVLKSAMTEGLRIQNELNIATQVYTQMQQQTELARGKVQEEKPVFAVIQPATVPIKPSDSRKNKVIVFAFLGGILSSGWVLFGKSTLHTIKDLLKESKA